MTTPGAGPQLDLYEDVSVTLDGSGNGTARLGTIGPRESWAPTAVSVSASSNAAEAQCRIYAGPAAAAQYFVDGTLSGSTGDATGQIAGTTIARTQGQPYIWAVWTGGDPGAVATMVVTGSKTVS